MQRGDPVSSLPNWKYLFELVFTRLHLGLVGNDLLLNIGDQIGGLAVVSIEPKELTVVNIVGPINLEKLSQLEGSFGVPYLNLPPAKTKTDK